MTSVRTFASVLGFAVAFVAAAFGVVAAVAGPELRFVELGEPYQLLVAIVPVLAFGARAWLRPAPATFGFSRHRAASKAAGRGIRVRLAHVPDGLRLAAGVLMALALARPQSSRLSDVVRHEGIDIVFALDLSESMEAGDLFPSRLEAAKAVIDEMIAARPHDRIGLVVFGATASTVSPLTMDHDVLRALLRKLRIGLVDGTRTAIGAGLGVALNRLEESDSESKVVVLLTDGVHNAEGIDPDAVASEAAERGVKVFTVLMGRHGTGSIDPARLERIASVTGGYAYTAEDVEALRTTFQDILDRLEKSEIEGRRIRAELFGWPAAIALLFLLLDAALRNTFLRRFP
ncbi:MAG: VWA domain-containing protein [Deltaproteobacteria bacterium]|nr:MAG: VWA domain-containing protein [Deltaproteobacteria bacterium]